MSAYFGKIVSLILSERFGPVVEKVGTFLHYCGSSPLLYVKKYTDLPLSKVKESLAILIKYQLVSFTPNKNENVANYALNGERVLLHLRYAKYINHIKKKFGDEAEMILEEILQRSYWTASEVIVKVAGRLMQNDQNTSLSQIRDIFISLVTAKYLMRLPYCESEDKPVPKLFMPEKEMYLPPPVDISILARTNTSVADFPDRDIYWTVNFDRFHQDIRDKIIVQAFKKKFDDNAAELIKLMLRQMYIRTEPWVEVSNPIPIIEVKDIIRKQPKFGQLISYFDQYINVIEQDQSNLIRKFGEASGGSFQIHLKEAFTQFAWEIVEQVILEKFDSKAARIFRLVKMKKYIDIEKIQQLAMIPSKEAKRLTYLLLEENFFHIQELKKGTGGRDQLKSFMLFHIKLEQVVRMIMELCHKTLFNIITRRNHERLINKRIIDKKQRVDTIALSMRAQGASEEQLGDIEEMITPPEREILESIDKTMKKLNTVELEIDETIFLLQMYLRYA